jgi:hypothetical protein
LVGKPERNIPLEELRNRWENNIRKDLREMGFEGVGWKHLLQDSDQ